jgi:ABC-2 type transport system permease protein
MNTTLTLTKFSLKGFFRNRQALFFTIFFPLITMGIFGLIGFDKPQTFDATLITGNPQPATQEFVDQIKKFQVLKITESNLETGLKDLRAGDTTVVINIPDDFITTAPSQPKELTVYINEAKQGEAQAIVSILSQYLDKTSLRLSNAPTYFAIRQEVVDSKHLKYIDFLLPGLLAMSIMQMSVFSVAFVLVQYKEKGVLRRLLATPMQAWQFIAANVITRLIVSVLQAAIFIAMGLLVLKAHIIGSYFLILLCVILGVTMFLGMGFTVSGIAKTVDSVPALANIFVFPMLFLGGVFFSNDSMPSWLQKVSKLLPLTPFSTALREVMTKGAGFSDIAGNLGGMLIWSIILIGIATLTFRIQEKDSI